MNFPLRERICRLIGRDMPEVGCSSRVPRDFNVRSRNTTLAIHPNDGSQPKKKEKKERKEEKRKKEIRNNVALCARCRAS